MKEDKYSHFRIVLDTPDSTLICNSRDSETSKKYHKQSEQELERQLIKILESQGYEYCPEIKSEKELKNNLRRQLEKLNSQRIPGFKFTDSEWRRFYSDEFEGPNNTGIENRTKKIQKGDCVFELIRDSGTACNITIFNKKHPQNNYLQVINQFSDFERNNRYDVTILVNGLPLVHIELKMRGVALVNAFHQSNYYRDHSFSDLFEFVQIFIISNGTNTKYYSNTTKKGLNNNSFQFTSFWSYADNKTLIRDLVHFAKTFLQKRTLLEVLAKYCVLDSRGVLKILRPYQIAAIERIICRIVQSIDMNLKGKDSGGYIWHTTGAGKTLTSFKAAQIAIQIPDVKKVLFVVDRKDLDSQTYIEYKNFLGDVEDKTIDNTDNTEKLKELINDIHKPRIIITTIQKLRRLLVQEKKDIIPEVLKSKIVIIADECHRSQPSDLHTKIINKTFENKNLFGFTGTPLRKNEDSGPVDETKKIFGKCLHEYKIIDAIKDDNVLRFSINYVLDVSKNQEEIDFDHPNRIKSIVGYIIDKFSNKTHKGAFNSMMAVDSISLAIKYYQEFKRQQESLNNGQKLKIAMIFHDSPKFKEGDENENKKMDVDEKKLALKEAIDDYNKMFNSNIQGFNAYREDVSRRTKNKELDILLVVDMFLTGFDAPMLNTIWIDKNLKDHGLIQAFSRTNRILSKQKTHGNVVCFRDLKKDVDDALLLFAVSSEDAIEIRNYIERIAQYKDLVKNLRENFSLDEELVGEQKEKDFINIFGKIMNLRSSLSCDDEFEKDDPMSDEEIQNYRSRYIDLMNKYREHRNNEKVNFHDDVVFEYELMRVDEVGVDYIQNLLDIYYGLKEKYNMQDQKTELEQMREKIIRFVNSSIVFSKEKAIVYGYLDFVDSGGNLKYQDYKKREFYNEMDRFIEEEQLNPEGTKKHVEKFIEERETNFRGTQIRSDIMPKIPNLIVNYQVSSDKWTRVKDKIEKILEKFNAFEYW